MAGFAPPRRRNHQQFRSGEGLVGQCVAERKRLPLQSYAAHFFTMKPQRHRTRSYRLAARAERAGRQLRVAVRGARSHLCQRGRTLAGMLAVFAEFERDILRDRVKAGIAQARRDGNSHGRPPAVRQYADDIQAIHGDGISKSEIARRLPLSRTSVRRVLKP